MALEGKLKKHNGLLYVVYSTTEQDTRTAYRRPVIATRGDQYYGSQPSEGDEAVSASGDNWNTYSRKGHSGVVSTGPEIVDRMIVKSPSKPRKKRVPKRLTKKRP